MAALAFTVWLRQRQSIVKAVPEKEATLGGHKAQLCGLCTIGVRYSGPVSPLLLGRSR